MHRLVFPVLLSIAGCVACGRPADEPAPAAAPTTAADAPALHDAARAGELVEVRRLIEQAGTPVDAGDRYGMTALMMAADRGHVELVRYLIDAGADVNRRERFFNMSAFDLAVGKERAEVLPLLLAAGSDQREEALELAVQENRINLARSAVQSGPLYEATLAQLKQRTDLAQELRELLATAATRPDRAPPSYTRTELVAFEGSFETFEPGGPETRARITATDTGLSLVVGDAAPVPLAATGEREFRSQDGGIEASFWGRLGTVESLTLQRGSEPALRLRHSVAEPVGTTRFEPPAEIAAEAAEVHWPQFRGKDAAGLGGGSGFPSQWSVAEGRGIRWQVAIPGLGNSSPIVWGDRIILTTAVAEGLEQTVRTGQTGAGDSVDERVEHSWRVMAFDKRTGAPLWDTEIARAIPRTQRHFKASQASSSPVTDGRRVVAVFPTAGLVCLDLDGNLQWKHDLGGLNASSPGDPGAEWGFASSPIIWDDRVILLVDTFDDPYIAAWSLATGEPLWKTARDGPPSWSTPTVAHVGSSDELVVNGATIRGYDPRTGGELWSLAPNSELVIATPVVGAGLLYVSAGYAPIKPIYAVRLGARGRLDVEPGQDHASLAWSHDRGGAYMPTPLLYQGLLYVVHHNGRIVAYDAATGDAIYKERFSAGGTFTASPVAAEGKLFIATEEGQVYVIEAGPSYREIAVNEMGEPLMATPALSEGTLYVRTTERLVAVGG